MNVPNLPDDMLRVALLEDDLVLRDRILIPKLQRYGFEVDPFEKAAELYPQLTQRRYHIVVLDIGLPDEDGFSVSRRLRAVQPELGIVILTGRHEAPDHIRGLTEGADAYLTKPVDIEILAATLHSLSRRLQSAGAEQVAAPGVWRLDTHGWCLLSPAGQLVALTKTERRLMARMMKAHGEVVPREELIAALTSNVYDFDPHRIDSMVHRLRRKVSDRSGETLPLVVVHGTGYVMGG
jgi:DNA-binding response OmpR family regulator